ncbi:ATP-grasp domain-containing protein [Streptomyces sp. NPDC050704]|uniref:ATP-grasp domain-containing protein n=1 Tax=Streptomyces sp. NPDC050704 TaxID=3157219 RepID=UPI00342FBC76
MKAKSLGHRVTFVQARDVSLLRATATPDEQITAALEHVDRLVTVERLEADLAGAVRRIDADSPVHAVLTTSELAVLPTAHTAAALGLRTTPPDHLRQAVHKGECRTRLHRAGIRSPRHATVTTVEQALDAARELGFPLVAKPSRGVGKESTAIVGSESGLKEYFAGLRAQRAARSTALDGFISTAIVLESYLEGVLYSAEIVAGGGDPRVLLVTRRERAAHNELFEVAAVMPAGLSPDESAAVETYMRGIFRELGLTVGVYHVEFIMTREGPALVEINARMMGGMSPFLYHHVTGTDPFEILIREHLGEPLELPVPPFRRAGIVVAFSSVEGGVAPVDAERRIAEVAAEYRPLRHSLAVRDGQPIAKMTGNFSVFGYFCLEAADAGAARALGRELISDMGQALGLRLAEYR